MPQGVPSNKELDKLIAAAFKQILSGGSGPSVPSGPTSFLSDPNFLNSLGSQYHPSDTERTAAIATRGRGSDTMLPADVAALQASVNRIGFKKEHHSIFHKILDNIERPYHAITGFEHGAITKAVENEIQGGGPKALINPKNWGNEFVAGAKGFTPGLRNKTRYTGIDLLEASDPDPAKRTIGKIPLPITIALALGEDVALDPLSYTGVGAATKIKELGRTEEAIKTAKDMEKTLHEAGHTEEAQGIANQLLGGDLKAGKWYKNGALPNSAQRAETIQRISRSAEKYGNAKYDQLLKTLTETATKQVADQGYKKFNSVKELRTSLKGTGKLSKYGGNVSKAQLEQWNLFVDNLIKKQGPEAFKYHNADDVARAAKEVEEKAAAAGNIKYGTAKELRTALKGTGRLGKVGGNVSKAHLDQWNSFVDNLIKHNTDVAVHGLQGAKLDRMTHVREATAKALEIATKNNLVGKDAARQLDKRLALRIAGKDVAHIRTPKIPEEYGSRLRTTVNTAFRTGSHIDPAVNAMRLATHSSVIDQVNHHVENIKKIWEHVSPNDRLRVAEAVIKGSHNVMIQGGHDLIHGTDVNDLVGYTRDELERLQKLIGDHEGAAVTLAELNKELPAELQLNKHLMGKGGIRAVWDNNLAESATALQKRIAEDPATFLHTIQKGVLTALAHKNLRDTIIDRFGHQIKGTQGFGMANAKNPATEILVKNHGYRTPMLKEGVRTAAKPIEGYEKHVFDPDTASGIEAMHQMLENSLRVGGRQSAAEALKTFDTATQMFKSVVTKFNPGFHERNLIGEIMNSMADGVVRIKPYRQSLQVLRIHGKTALDTGEVIGSRKGLVTRRTIDDSRVHNAINPDAYKQARIAAVEGNDIIMRKHVTIKMPDGTVKHLKGITADMFWHAYIANGLKTGWISTEFGKVVSTGTARKALSKFNTGAQHLTENIEDYSRLAHFIDRIERSKFTDFERAAEDAAQYVRKFHFDYTDFTHFERNVASRAIPFYKWTRKNIPLQMALLFQKPGYMLAQQKALNAISQGMGYRSNGELIPNAREVMPLWLKDALAVPVGQGQTGTRYLDAPLPTADAFRFFGEGPGDTFRNLVYMGNPWVKDPIEIATKHQIGGAPLSPDRYAAGMTPYTNLLNNLMNKGNTGKSTQLLQFLSGLGLMENTPARIKSELKREQSEGSARRKKYRTSHGALPVGGRS
jgi:hypothetical protein